MPELRLTKFSLEGEIKRTHTTEFVKMKAVMRR